MNGVDRISAAFDDARNEGRAAFMPYFTLGYPDREASLEVVEALVGAGADMIELGVPFSDPLADGPVIQQSTQTALQQGINVAGCLDLVRRLRVRGVGVPLLLMGYINPILAYGVQRYATEAVLAGADGLIVPDLPPEEAGDLSDACRKQGLALIFLLAPSSTPERIALAAANSTGFVYLVSVRGVTGARAALPADLAEFVARVRAVTDQPLAVGFGISSAPQAAAVGRLADGVIVGSAIIQTAGQAPEPARAAAEFARRLADSLRRDTAVSSRA